MSEITQLKRVFIFTIITVIAACSSFTNEDAMRRFVESTDNSVMRQEKIHGYLDPHSGVTLEGVKEVRPGILEYSLLAKYPIFYSAEKRCRFIFVVQKDTGTIIDWRYNGKAEYCTQNRG
jgi:hypothetical protein